MHIHPSTYPYAPDNRNIIVKAIIKGNIVTIDMAGRNRHEYKEMQNKIKYLGKGYYHSYNGVKASDPKMAHFWKYIK